MAEHVDPHLLAPLELCCRSLAQRILLARELQRLWPDALDPGDTAVGGWEEQHGEEPVPARTQGWQEIWRHIAELPELEGRFDEACAALQQGQGAAVLAGKLGAGSAEAGLPEQLRELLSTGNGLAQGRQEGSPAAPYGGR